MKKRLIAASFLVGVVAIDSATAAGPRAKSATEASAAPAIAYTWSGFFVGAHAGYGSGHSHEAAPVFGTQINFDISGGLAGAQIGYNWQAGGWVFGVEADGTWTDINGDTRCPNPAFTCAANVRELATLRGRLGWAVGPALLYATGGLGHANVRYTTGIAAVGLPGFGIINDYRVDRWGYAVGVGLEYGLAANWSAKIEYLHHGFDDITAPAGALGPPIVLGLSVDTVKAGVNYRFGWDERSAAQQ